MRCSTVLLKPAMGLASDASFAPSAPAARIRRDEQVSCAGARLGASWRHDATVFGQQGARLALAALLVGWGVVAALLAAALATGMWGWELACFYLRRQGASRGGRELVSVDTSSWGTVPTVAQSASRVAGGNRGYIGALTAAVTRLTRRSTQHSFAQHQLRARAEMLLGCDGSLHFGEHVRTFFLPQSTDAQRSVSLGSVSKAALAELLRGLETAPTHGQARKEADAVCRQLLEEICGPQASTAAYKKQLRRYILRMHGDRQTPCNVDFGCQFKNDQRDLLWRLVIFLGGRCNSPSFAN